MCFMFSALDALTITTIEFKKKKKFSVRRLTEHLKNAHRNSFYCSCNALLALHTSLYKMKSYHVKDQVSNTI